MMRRIEFAFALFIAAPHASAQWRGVSTPGMPRTADGKPNLTAPAPRNAEGKPDISGLWQGPPPPDYLYDLPRDLKPGELTMTPWAKAIYDHRRATESKDDPSGFCVPGGVPRSYLPSYPFKIVSTPGVVFFLFEAIQTYRQVFTDGRKLVQDPSPTWMGYSLGHWDEDSFVIETTGFHNEGWIDSNGHPLSDALHLTERLLRKDFGHMNVQITVDDPKAYTKPWTVNLPLRLLPDGELIEYICSENNKDALHYVGK